MDELKRQSMIAYLRNRMLEFGIKPDDLAAALAADHEKLGHARYRNPHGDTWDGTGHMHSWLKQAVSAGQTLEHFQITKSPLDATHQKGAVDWGNDPFAGTRLAHR